MSRFKELTILGLLIFLFVGVIAYGASTSSFQNQNVTGNVTIRGQFINITSGNITMNGGDIRGVRCINFTSGGQICDSL